MKALTFKTYTFGCRVNQAETNEIGKSLQKAGFQTVKSDQLPNIVIINTCIVTKKAEKEVRQLARRVKRENPQSFLVVCGCAVNFWQKNGFPKLPVDLWINNKEKRRIAEILKKELSFSPISLIPLISPKSDRQIIKIQDGCNQFCSYCIVPYLRGKPRSKKISQIVKEVKQAKKRRIKEIVLSGINLGLFGQDTNENVPELLQAILKKTQVSRVSFGSIYPEIVNDEFINVYTNDWEGDKRLCYFFHLPLQSGSEKILKSMGRKYGLKKFKSIIKKLHQTLPQALIATDVIVGFPGETEEEFQKTYHFLKNSPIFKFHVFRFSPRKGTLAAKMEREWGRVEEKTKKQRSETLRKLGKEKYKKFLKVAKKQTL